MSLAALAALAGVVGVAAVVAVATAVRHRVAARLALRSAARRPSETALVTVGALLGTAIIVGSLTVGDTVTSSVRSGAFTPRGPGAESVPPPGGDSLPRRRQAIPGLADDPAVDGLVAGLRAPGTAAARLGGADSAVEPEVLLAELDFERAGQLGGDPPATGLDEATTPAPGQAAVSADLAAALELDVGDELTVFAYGASPQLRVAAVLPQRGLAGYAPGLNATGANVFLAPGTLAQLATGAAAQEAPPPVAFAFVSNQGGVLGGAERTDAVTALVRERIAPLSRAQVSATKQQLLDSGEEIGDKLSNVFLGLGTFAVVAGVLLLVNVFVMLAEERRGELGIMRAVGMRRGQLVRAFFLEGGLYAVAAAVVGAVAGVGVGAGVVQLAKGISGGSTFTLDLAFAAEPTSVAGGLLVGLTISLATILATSARVSRLTIINAIRGLAEPPRSGRRLAAVTGGGLAAVVGLVISGAAVTAQAGVGMLVGPAVLASGLAVLAGRLARGRLPITVAGLAVIAWGVAAPTLSPEAFANAEIGIFVVQGLVVTGAAVAVLAANQDALGRLARRAVGGRASLTARLGLAYPLAQPFRTTMTLSMYALVVFTLVLVSLVSQVFGGQVAARTQAESGGYDLLVDSAPAEPVAPRELRQRTDVEAVAALRHAEYEVAFRAPGHSEFRRWFASGFDGRFLHRRPPALDRWLPGLDGERAAWKHVLAEPSAMIIGSRFLQEGGESQRVELGDIVEMRNPITGATEQRTIAGVMEGGAAFSGAFMSQASLQAVLGDRAPTSRLYVAVDDQAEASAVAATLERSHIANGVQARTFRAVVAGRQQQNRQFLRLLQGYLALGLLVGVAGLGVIMVRAVRERRTQIAVLRSLGLQPGAVGRSFVLEAGFVALQGVLVGALLATATGYQLITNAAAFGGVEPGFAVPWVEIGLLLGTTVAVSLLAAGWPARQASRISPALALQTAE
jgi:putative ABC transport system permease protein